MSVLLKYYSVTPAPTERDGQRDDDEPVLLRDDLLGVVLPAVVDHLVTVGDAAVEPVEHQLRRADHHCKGREGGGLQILDVCMGHRE